MNITKEIDKAVEIYSNQVVIRSAIVAIPFVGSSIDTLLNGRASKIQTERILNAVNKLKDELEKVEDSKIDKLYLESEEFYDDIISYFNNITKERSELKVGYYSKILKERLEGSIVEIGTRQIYEALSNLSEDEVIILREIYEYTIKKEGTMPKEEKGKKQFDVNSKILKGITNFDLDFDYLLIRLEKEGFIKERTGTYLDYSGGDYYITSLTRKLMLLAVEEKG